MLELYPIQKLVMFLIWIPMFLLVRFAAGLVATPDWVSAFGILEVLIAVVLTIPLFYMGKHFILGPEPQGGWEPGMLALIVICVIGFFALAIWEGFYMHRADYPKPDPQAERLRDQIRETERVMRGIPQLTPDSARTQPSPEANRPKWNDPDAIQRLNEERLLRLQHDAQSGDGTRRRAAPSTRPGVR